MESMQIVGCDLDSQVWHPGVYYRIFFPGVAVASVADAEGVFTEAWLCRQPQGMLGNFIKEDGVRRARC